MVSKWIAVRVILLFFLFSANVLRSNAAPPANPALTVSTVTLATSGSPSASAALVTFTATVSSSGTPIGTISFMDGSTDLADVQLHSGAAVLKTTALRVGTHSVTAVYIGDSSHAGATSNTIVQVVSAAATASALFALPDPSASGAPAKFTATVTSTAGQAQGNFLTGNFSFNDGMNLLATVGLSPGTINYKPLFNSPTIGKIPQAMEAGDLDNDGNLDLVTANTSDNTVSILLGNGDGSFQTQKIISVGAGPFDITLGDFNQDGILDMAVANMGDNTVTVLLGNGDGTFTLNATLMAGLEPTGVTTADLNGDGKLDLITANNADNTVTIFLGNGDGSFGSGKSFTAGNATGSGGPGAIDVEVGDFNGDGIPDLAVANIGADTVSILRGNGDGTFQTPKSFSVGFAPGYVIVGDFNGDSILDVGTANDSDSTISILLGNGDGTFQPQQQFAVGLGPVFPHAVDLLGRGILDVVTANSGDSTISVLLGNGDGTFRSQLVFAGPNAPGAMAVGDFDGGGVPDIATGDTGGTGNTVTIMLGSLSASATFTTSSLSVGTHAITASYSGDANYNSSTSGPWAQTVTPTQNPSSTSVILLLGPNPSIFGDQLTFQTVVTPSGATGTVTFFDGLTTLGVVPLTSGFARFSTSALTAGPHTITVQYSGDLNFFPSTSNPLMQSVNPATPLITWPALSPIFYGNFLGFQQLNAMANVPGTFAYSPPLGTMLPAGQNQPLSVTFTPADATDFVTIKAANSITVFPAALTVAADSASRIFNTPNPVFTGSLIGVVSGDTIIASFNSSATISSPAGTYAIVPTLSDPGSKLANYTVLSENGTLTINPAFSSTALASSLNPANLGVGITFTATMTSAQGTPTTGSVVFQDGGIVLGTIPSANGTAQFTTSGLASGTHNITANYAGSADHNFVGSSSLVLTQVVNPAADFVIAAAPPSETIHDGQSATFTLNMIGAFGFTGQVTLSCGGLPALAQCQFAPATVSVAGLVTSTLTITTVAGTAAMQFPGGLPQRRLPPGIFAYAAGLVVAGLIFANLPRRNGRRAQAALIVFAAGVLLAASLVGCGGGGGSGSNPQPGTPLGTSTVTVTATTAGGAITHSVPVTLTIVQ